MYTPPSRTFVRTYSTHARGLFEVKREKEEGKEGEGRKRKREKGNEKGEGY